MTHALFASASREGEDLDEALDDAADEIRSRLGDARPDIVFLFVSPAYGPRIDLAPDRMRMRLGARHVIGCTGVGVVECGGEVENRPAVALLAGSLPGATLSTFHLRHERLLGMESPDDLRAEVGLPTSSAPTFVILADPFTVDTDLLLARLTAAYPRAPAVGGLASGGTAPGKHRVFVGGRSLPIGAVGLAIVDADVRSVVSQGCRPVGRRFVITKADRNRIHTLSGRPAAEAIRAEVASLSEADQALARSSLLIGRVTNEAQDEFDRGDFVVRNVLGVLRENGALVVGDRVRVGQTVQLQLRDRETAVEDLDHHLALAAESGTAPRGALAFVCSGRGERLFGEPDHDVNAVRRHLGDVPTAGFFCNGEIGPVGGRNFVHGFTTSLLLL